MTEPPSPQALLNLLPRYTTPFPAVPVDYDDEQFVDIPIQRPYPTHASVYAKAQAASRLVTNLQFESGAGIGTSSPFAVTFFYLVVVHYALDAAQVFRQGQESISVDEWYHVSDSFIHEGYDRALLCFYPLGEGADGTELAPRGTQFLGGGRGYRCRPPSRARVEAWCRAALDAQLRRWVAGEEQYEKSPGPFISSIRVPFVDDLRSTTSGCEDIVWESSEGTLRAMKLQVLRRGWVWNADTRIVRARIRTASSVH